MLRLRKESQKRSILVHSVVGKEMGATMLSRMVIPDCVKTPSTYEITGETKRGKIPSIWKQMKSLSLNDQVKQLASKQLSDVDLRLRWQFAVDLFYLLREVFPSCEIYLFGSLITGLADKSSDIDIYVDWKGDSGRSLARVTWSERMLRIDEIQSRVASLLESAKCSHTGLPFAADVECIGSRVPIVRFQHFVSGINCDLSFGSKLSVNNSKLIKFYLDYDPRVKPIIVFLRNWAEYWNLAGSRKIKKYALTLLAIVFFAKKRIIPSIEQLQICASAERFDNKIKTEDHIIQGWDSSFCTDLNRIHQLFEPDADTMLPPDYHENPGATFLQTSQDFFELISKTDFKEYIVCPLLGQMIPKDDLICKSVAGRLSSTKLRRWRKSYITERSFCQETKILQPLVIQDPFDLDHNVALLVNKELQEKFSLLCEDAYAQLSTSLVTSVLDVLS